MEQRKPRRPAMLDDQTAERIVGDVDPALRSQAAHTTAAVLVQRGRAGAEDPDLLARPVALVDTEGPDTIAYLWSPRSPTSPPASLGLPNLTRMCVRSIPSTRPYG